MILRTIAAAALATAVLAPAAAAHGGGGAAKGYSSRVTAIQPADPAIHAEVLYADDQLQLRLDGDGTVIIDGYQNEPYLKFDPTGTYVNTRSPARYLNDDRYGKVQLPTLANAKAQPAWHKVSPAGQPYQWHDHRIHWMSATYPPMVSADESVAHHIFDWTIPGTVDGKPLAIQGTLDYKPLPGQTFPKKLLIPIVLLLVGGLVLVIVRNRSGARSGPQPNEKPPPKQAIPKNRPTK